MRPAVFLATLVFSLEAAAGISFEQLSGLADNPEHHQGVFTQEKYLVAVDASLSSSGNFSYRRGESIRWHIQQPIETELLLSPTGISSTGHQGLLLTIDGGDNPVAVTMGKFLFALLTSDWEKLAALFELSGEVVEQRWHATLVPIDTNLAQLFSRIEISGAGLLEKIVMFETSGDRTTIHLDQAQ